MAGVLIIWRIGQRYYVATDIILVLTQQRRSVLQRFPKRDDDHCVTKILRENFDPCDVQVILRQITPSDICARLGQSNDLSHVVTQKVEEVRVIL